MLKYFLVPLFFCFTSLSFGQKKNYFVLQGGGNVGFANEGYKGAFNGYSFNFVFGKNFDEKAYVGLGIGNENFKGKYISNDPKEQLTEKIPYNQQTIPLFIDGRLPIGQINNSSKIGLVSNLGYAPNFGMHYDTGFMFKGGFYYNYETRSSMNYILSASYGYQQLTKNYYKKDFQHQHFNISIGIWFK